MMNLTFCMCVWFQFSAIVLCGLLNQAEQVFKDTSPVDMDNQQQTEW